MIAADTSAWIDYYRGKETDGAKLFELALSQGNLVVPSPVLFELLSGRGMTKQAAVLILQLPRLETLPGFWERAGEMRQAVLKKGLRARPMDCLIAQNCIDHETALIAEDQDYRHFVKLGLKLA